jgi:hypothetical protein
LLVLDPAVQSTIGFWTPPGPVPKQLRSFGRVPNIDQWLPGDLILVSAARPAFSSRGIIQAQEEGGFAPEHARWHHAAVYVGDLRICEATVLRGVVTEFLYRYIGSHLLRVRRPPGLKPDQHWQIAVNALFRLGQNYSAGTILKMFWRSRRGFWNPSGRLSPPISTQATICSQLYADAYSLTTRQALGNTAGETPSPAFLSSTPQLQDVALGWYSIG